MATNNKIPKCPPLRFPDFNDEWKETTLGEVGETYTGLSGKSSEDFGKGSPYITYKMVYDGVKINLCNTEYVYVSESEKQNQVRLGDILFTTSSETPEETGLCSVLLSSSDELYLNSFCFGYRLNEESLATSIFLGYALRSPIYRIKLSTLAQGSTRYNISKSEVMRMPLSLPSLAEQKKIADFLSLIDERITNLSETIKERKREKAGLLNQLFSQKLRFPDFNDEWKETTLGEVLIKPQQKAVEDPTTTELITVKLHCKGIVNTGKYPNKTEKGRAYYIRYMGELLIGKQNFHNGGIGIVPQECSGKICSNAIASYISKGQYIEYIYYYISRETYYSLFEKYLGGTGQKEISASEFNNLPISLPSLAEQKKIADFLSLIDERIEVEEQLLQQYEKQKRYLLRQMFV